MTTAQLYDEFDEQFSVLCAAFDRSYTSERREAYRTAFVGKLTAAQVARIVERVLGEQGPEKLPSIRELWQTWRALRAAAPRRIEQTPTGSEWSDWDRSANIALLSCARLYPERNPQDGWDLARRLGAQFQALADDGDAQTFQQLKAAMLREYERLPAVA